MSTWTVPGIIDALGGPTKIGRATGLGISKVSEWKRQGSIPARHWQRLLGYARSEAPTITAEALVAAHAPDADAEVA
jgi:hypothetical protein